MEIKVEALIKVAQKAAYEAGKKIIEIYEQPQINFELKDDHSPLTAADMAANRIICGELQKTNLPVLSEEGRNIPFDERKDWTEYWLIDPLDGSKEFIKRNGEFTINIALMSGATPVAGLVYAPCLDLMYFSFGSNTAYKSKNGRSEQLIAKETKSCLEDVIALDTVRVVASRSHLNKETEDFIGQFKKTELSSMGSSLKFMLLAEDRADIYPRIAPTMEWDTAAAHAILLALNKNIYQASSSNPLSYNKENLKNPAFIAY